MQSQTAQQIIEQAVALGAERPAWQLGTQIMRCWRDRAEWLCSVARSGRDTSAAIAECDRYSGHRAAA